MAKKTFNRRQLAAAAEATHRTAGGNPVAVRQAFIAGAPIMVGEFAIQPLHIGTFWLLEDIKSPFVTASVVAGSAEAAPRATSFRDIAEAALILIDPQRARQLLESDRRAFTDAAFDLATKIPMADLQKLGDAIAGRVQAAEAVTPPPGKSDTENPTDSPARAPGSAGG